MARLANRTQIRSGWQSGDQRQDPLVAGSDHKHGFGYRYDIFFTLRRNLWICWLSKNTAQLSLEIFQTKIK